MIRMHLKKEDLRTKRTRENIIRAFVSITNEKGLEKVTVQQIADRAMINRSTFYNHFLDKNDLYDHIFNSAMSTFSLLRDIRLFRGNIIHEEEIINALTLALENAREQREIFLLIFSTTTSTKLLDRLRAMLEDNISGVFFKLGIHRHSSIPSNLVLTILVSSFVGMMKWWLEDNQPVSARSLAENYVKIMKNNYQTLVKK